MAIAMPDRERVRIVAQVVRHDRVQPADREEHLLERAIETGARPDVRILRRVLSVDRGEELVDRVPEIGKERPRQPMLDERRLELLGLGLERARAETWPRARRRIGRRVPPCELDTW